MGNKTRNNNKKTKKTKNDNPILINDLVYTYTSKSIIVSKKQQNTKEGIVTLDDYSDLSSYITYFNKGYKCIRVVLESYNLYSIKDHIIRINNIVKDGNCPHLDKLLLDDQENENDIDKVVDNMENNDDDLVVV